MGNYKEMGCVRKKERWEWEAKLVSHEEAIQSKNDYMQYHNNPNHFIHIKFSLDLNGFFIFSVMLRIVFVWIYIEIFLAAFLFKKLP